MKTPLLNTLHALWAVSPYCKHRPAGPAGSRGIRRASCGRPPMALHLCVSAAFLLLGLSLAQAQGYSVDWYKVSGGGGTSSGGMYSLTGTIGQHDAGMPMTGGSFSLTGGFWSLLSVVQTPGLPELLITHSGHSVIVSWQDTGSYTLQQNNNMANPGGWVNSAYPITTLNGTNSITVNPPMGNLFFRLKQ
jgi:hypothetical protein